MRLVALLTLFGLLNLSGCASEEMIPDNAHPYADIAPSFMTQEPRSVRESGDTPNKFFYNECSATGNSGHNSKTSYFCEDTRF